MTDPRPIATADLSGPWSLTAADGTAYGTMDLPGDVLSALVDMGHCPDPYWGQNELEVRWVADTDWRLSRTFTVAETDQSLHLSQLDCVATVSVNGTLVLKAQNAFRRYRIDLSDLLQIGENRIEITLHSPTKAANARQAAQPYPVPYTQNYPVPNGNMLRKPQCDFGWDWNAALMPMGLYGDIRLEPNRSFRVRDVLVHQSHEAGTVEVRVTPLFEGAPEDGTVIRASLCGVTGTATAADGTAEVTLGLSDPVLWWPNGQGDQVLHDLTLQIGDQTVTKRIGLREIELVSEPDAAGRSFGFRVNGRDVFAKGANWIPADALPSAITKDGLRDLLQSARDAHMNMIRVWGGGWYETDDFYDLCDELGLMVWQDAMFACSLYPADEEFLDEVTAEVADNAARLQHRASLALWCGDNEMLGALTGRLYAAGGLCGLRFDQRLRFNACPGEAAEPSLKGQSVH